MIFSQGVEDRIIWEKVAEIFLLSIPSDNEVGEKSVI